MTTTKARVETLDGKASGYGRGGAQEEVVTVSRTGVPVESGVQRVHTSLELQQGSAERYEVLEELGRGGMGEVHLVFDRRIGRRVARKRRTKGGAELKRFLREISVQGQLEHPTIVPLHDLSIGDDGDLYFTMKCIRGRTLKSILAARRDADPQALAQFPLRKLLHAFSNACLGVAFAHSRGVIHRDLKPDNLMLGEFGEVYVLDWGVAKLSAPGEADEAALRVPLGGSATKHGAVVGTAGYMSPEQCAAQPNVDEQSDVYSLGAILFEMLAGEPLHSGMALERVDSTLSGVDVHARAAGWAEEAGSALVDVCARAIAVLRDDRLKTARELSEAVERSLDVDRDRELRRGLAVEASATHRLERPKTDPRATWLAPVAAPLTSRASRQGSSPGGASSASSSPALAKQRGALLLLSLTLSVLGAAALAHYFGGAIYLSTGVALLAWGMTTLVNRLRGANATRSL